MERYKRQIPDGVQDTLPVECAHKRALQQRISRVFMLNGCFEVETPTYEYYDVFASGIGSVNQEKLQKFFDEKGRILVLRPDITMPIARLAATRLYEGLPLRLCYTGNAFGTDNAFYSVQKEFTQSGVEFIGASGVEVDAQLIALAIEALDAAGLADYTIELGQVEFFKGLMEDAGLSEEDADTLRGYVDDKNILEVELFLKQLKVDDSLAKCIKRLTTLYGGPEVFDEAYAFSSNPRCRKAIDNLKALYGILEDFGIAEKVSVDLSMLQSMDYYSGMVFKGISGSIGQPVLSGGRYDNLIAEFGRDIPATGFCLYIKRILIALDRQGALVGEPRVDVVISAAPARFREAYQMAAQLRSDGVITELALNFDSSGLEAYAKSKGAKAVYIADET